MDKQTAEHFQYAEAYGQATKPAGVPAPGYDNPFRPDYGRVLTMADLLPALRPSDLIETPKAPAKRYGVGRQGRRWGVYRNGKLIEGGFFERASACECADDYESEVPR